LQGRLTAEAAENGGDTLLEDFSDTYLNLTLKTTFMLKWAATACPRVKYVFKLDDDVYVNSERMWQLLGMNWILCSNT
jgi:beta-1,3-galactosyltransferase 1